MNFTDKNTSITILNDIDGQIKNDDVYIMKSIAFLLLCTLLMTVPVLLSTSPKQFMYISLIGTVFFAVIRPIVQKECTKKTSPASFILLSEMGKFIVYSSYSLCNNSKVFISSLQDLRKLSIAMGLAVLYVVQTYLEIFSLNGLTPSTYVLTLQTKLVFCVLLSYVVLNHELTSKTVMSCFLVLQGVVLSKFSQNDNGTYKGVVYFISALGCAFISGSGGVYSEYMMKHNYHDSDFNDVDKFIATQIQLTFTTLIVMIFQIKSLLTFVLKPITILNVFVMMLQGIFAGLTIFTSNAIMKTYATALSVCISSVISYYIFGNKFSLLNVLALVNVIMGIVTFSKSKPTKHAVHNGENDRIISADD